MTTLYDVPAEDLIEAIADRLAEDGDVEAPDWIEFTTTGVDRELPPEQDDFWPRRVASLLRKVAVDGPVGVGSLATAYGNTKDGSNRYQVRPPSQSDGSRKIIRTALQQLEDAGYVETEGNDGRVVTAEGRKLLDSVADDVLEELDRPELERYA
ncbi:30S ribosomal protein S19e [Halapricum hydrolyticum]|uniref:Small ribosomal subunit protein eS19 n=1 Tax=Halapricum hydrolyticum TaxID=2979991 RepID=A0AAE3I9A3_9EURY|nr:30S ribosomal protein S19e [Halapricum hydrolyticum]MCU4717244.1 30S ribosomal protein S19e [Halapricum hydrolyticum]MCU4726171.1 30S ribosomal protein S19e [Halapricum hydrolyticum]